MGRQVFTEFFRLEVGKSFDNGPALAKALRLPASRSDSAASFRRAGCRRRRFDVQIFDLGTCACATEDAVEQGAGRDQRARRGRGCGRGSPRGRRSGLFSAKAWATMRNRPRRFRRQVARDFDAAKPMPADRAPARRRAVTTRSPGASPRHETSPRCVTIRVPRSKQATWRTILDFEPSAGATGSGCAEQVASGIDVRRSNGASSHRRS